MNLSDATLAAVMERRHFLCLAQDGGKPTWVMLSFGRLFAWKRGAWVPFTPTARDVTADDWKISAKGPRTSSPRRKLSST